MTRRNTLCTAVILFLPTFLCVTAAHGQHYPRMLQGSVLPYSKHLHPRLKSLDSNTVLTHAIAHKLYVNSSSIPKPVVQTIPPESSANVIAQNSLKSQIKQDIENIVDQLSHRNETVLVPGKSKRKIFGRRLKIPEGSSISLAVQLSRPEILPGLFFQGDAIVMDAVIETPIWFELDTFANMVYDQSKPKPPGGQSDNSNNHDEPDAKSFVGRERCYLYDQAENLISSMLDVPRPVAQACLARMICELHAVFTFSPTFINSSVFLELMRLALSPSLEQEECVGPYVLAEKVGRKKATCQRYNRKCPVSLTNIVIGYLFSS